MGEPEGFPSGVAALEHTADVGLEVTASMLPELFTRAAEGAMALVYGGAPGVGAAAERRTLRLEAPDRAGLLHAWLRELLYLREVEGFAFRDADFSELSERALVAEVSGGEAGREAEREIKGVTWHGLFVEGGKHGWRARVIFDV